MCPTNLNSLFMYLWLAIFYDLENFCDQHIKVDGLCDAKGKGVSIKNMIMREASHQIHLLNLIRSNWTFFQELSLFRLDSIDQSSSRWT